MDFLNFTLSYKALLIIGIITNIAILVLVFLIAKHLLKKKKK